MIWVQTSRYSIRSGRWFIAKAMVDGTTLYSLFDDAGVRYGHWESSDEAKAEAEAMEAAGGIKHGKEK